MLLEPQAGIVYGPVHSRRLGRSLGINLLPAGRKVCTFDCRYCQYGWAAPVSSDGRASSLPGVRDVLDAVAAALARLSEPPDFLTFSGNGEATLHPGFGEIVDGVIQLRDRLAPAARTAILSNSSLLGKASVREALAGLDLRIMKLDVGTEARLQSYNQPPRGITLEAIVEGLASLPDITLQALFAGGPTGNLDDEEVNAWIERVASIRPRSVQIYTLDREAPCQELVKATSGRLEDLRARLAARGIQATVASP